MNLRSKLLVSTISLGSVLGGFGFAAAASPASAALPPIDVVKPPVVNTIPPDLVPINPCVINPDGPGCGPIVTIPDIPVIPIDPCVLFPNKPGCGPIVTIPGVPTECIVTPDACTDDIGEEPETPQDTPSADTPVKGRPTFTG